MKLRLLADLDTLMFFFYYLHFFSVSPGVSFSYVQGQAGDEDTAVDVKLYSHRWRRWLPPKPRNMDSNRASQEQDQEPMQEEPEGFPGLLSAEDTDNSSQIEVGDDSHKYSTGAALVVHLKTSYLIMLYNVFCGSVGSFLEKMMS